MESMVTFHLKNFTSFCWRWFLIMFVGVKIVTLLKLPHNSTIFIVTFFLLTAFAAWVWAWPVVIKRWRKRVFEEALDVKFENVGESYESNRESSR